MPTCFWESLQHQNQVWANKYTTYETMHKQFTWLGITLHNVYLCLFTSRRCSRASIASKLTSSAWLFWASLWLWATLCSWLWVRVRKSSNSLRREVSSLHFASRSISCLSRIETCRSASSNLAWRSKRSTAAVLVCLTSSDSLLWGTWGGKWKV